MSMGDPEHPPTPDRRQLTSSRHVALAAQPHPPQEPSLKPAYWENPGPKPLGQLPLTTPSWLPPGPPGTHETWPPHAGSWQSARPSPLLSRPSRQSLSAWRVHVPAGHSKN